MPGVEEDFTGGDGRESKLPIRVREPCEIQNSGILAVHHAFGLSSTKRNNVHMLRDNFVLTTVGAAAAVIHPETRQEELLFCPDEQGVGAIAVHPSQTFFAVGGKGNKPNVYIYTFPGKRIHRVLQNGTERAYSCMAFSAKGNKLATVGSAPDFLLTVWDWDEERIILRNKAFAQEVYNVSFAPDNDGFLTTSGLGHIRFWKMANTFTGLKLQGDLGKFGKVELSDVAAYAELPGGMVISGSESGSLLLWDGNFIKLELRLPGDKLPHSSEVSVCKTIRSVDGSSAGELLTAGGDGWLRWWSIDAIENAEVSDEEPFFELSPLREVHLEGVVPMTLCLCDGFVVIQDRQGAILQIKEPLLATAERELFKAGHAGPVADLACSPVDHFAVTVGSDHSVRLWDYITKSEVYRSNFHVAATSLIWAPKEVDALGRSILVGFEDGTVRVLFRAAEGFKLIGVFKPHNCPVTSLQYSSDGTQLITTAEDGTAFILNVILKEASFSPEYKPLGFVKLGLKINRARWSSLGDKIVFACNNGVVTEVTLPHESNNVKMPDTRESFELVNLPRRSMTFTRKPLKPKLSQEPEQVEVKEGEEAPEVKKLSEEELEARAKEQEEIDRITNLPPGNVVDFLLLPDDELLLAVDGADAGPIYVCSFSKPHPIKTLTNLPMDDGLNTDAPESQSFVAGTGMYASCSCLGFSSTKRFLLNGGSDGSLRIRPMSTLDCYAVSIVHDGTNGAISGLGTSFDENFLLSSGHDGSLFVHRIRPDALQSACDDLLSKAGLRIKAKSIWQAMHDDSPAKAAGKPQIELTAAQLRSNPAILDVASAELEGFAKVAPPNTGKDVEVESKAKETTDITDSNAYSIEDDKLKTEQDTKEQLAEIEKNKVRKVISQLRQDFEELLQANESDNVETRLEREEFDLDVELIASLEEDGKQQLNEVIKETQYNVNVSKAKLDKLRRHFLDDIIVDSITISGLQNDYTVQSFRTSRFSEALNEALLTVHDLYNGRGIDQHGNPANLALQSGGDNSIDAESNNVSNDMAAGSKQAGKDAASGKKAATGWEARKAGRQRRKAHLKRLLDTKPDQTADDPADIAAIDWVMNNMGDYKLKSADDYQVPLHKQVDAEKKRREGILLAESIQQLKMNFNEKFLALRELKRRIIEGARKDQARLKVINDELQQPDTPIGLPLKMNAEEWPEKRLAFDEDEMKEFVTGEKKASAAVATVTTTTARSEKGKDEVPHDTTPASPNAVGLACSSTPVAPPELNILPVIAFDTKSATTCNRETSSAFEQQDLEVNLQLLTYEKEGILKKSQGTIKAFDSAVYDLRKERAMVNASLVAAELRQIRLARELGLLNDFEKKDTALTKKLETCRAQKSEVVGEITACQEKLAAKKAEIELWQDKDRIITEEFNSIVGSDNAASGQLMKIFKRKIKRTRQSNGDGDEDEESESEEEGDYDDEEEDFEDGDPEEERCPDGCDQAIYEKILELREKRLDQEEVLNEFNKVIDELRKSSDRFQGREKQIDKELNATIVEIQAFQNEKQRKLNDIEVSTVLNLSQIACLLAPDAKKDDTQPASPSVEEFDDAMYEDFEEIDEDDQEIQGLKKELSNLVDQLKSTEVVDEEETLAQQEQLLSKVKQVKVAIQRKRKSAREMLELKSQLVLPATVDSTLLFDENDLHELHAGIGKLIAENKAKRAEFKGLHHTQKRLVKEKRLKEAGIAALQAKSDDLQMLKFGQIIDLDTIEKMGASVAVKDLKAKFVEQEKEQRREVAKVKRDIEVAQSELLASTRQNSALLHEIASLTETLRQLEVELNNTAGGGKAYQGGVQSYREMQDSQRLSQVVRVQNSEIEALKKEIFLLQGSNTRVNRNQVID